VVQTLGSNLRSALGLEGVDSTRSYSTSVVDTFRALGCEAAVCAAEREVRPAGMRMKMIRCILLTQTMYFY